jgi:hypothetical protein
MVQENSRDSARYRRPENNTFRLTRSRLISIGLDSAFLPATGDEHTHYSVYGQQLSDLTAADKRCISMIFSWNEDLLHRVNQVGLTVPQQAFDPYYIANDPNTAGPGPWTTTTRRPSAT